MASWGTTDRVAGTESLKSEWQESGVWRESQKPYVQSLVSSGKTQKRSKGVLEGCQAEEDADYQPGCAMGTD